MSSQPPSIPESVKNWNPVEVRVQSQDSLGVIALAVICVMLLVAYLRSQRELRTLLQERHQLK